MTIRREILQGAPIGRWHRIAYRDFTNEYAVAYPIGLHLVVKLCRRVWEWSYRYKPSRFERLLQAAEGRGMATGIQVERQKFEAELERRVKISANGDKGWQAFYRQLAQSQRMNRS